MNNKNLLIEEAKITKIVFEKDNYIIARTNKNFSIKGYNNTPNKDLKGINVKLTGKFEENKFGKTFVFSFIEVNVNPLYYFLKKIVKGFREENLNEFISKHSNEEIVDIFEKTPEKLLEIKGIGEKSLNKIVTNWKNYKHILKLSDFLLKYDITPKMVNNIYNHFCKDLNLELEKLIEDIKINPYILTNIRGVGFKKADNIALSIGLDPYSNYRIENAITFYLDDLAKSKGDTTINKDIIFKEIIELLNENIESKNIISSKNLEKEFFEIVTQLIEKKKLIKLNDYDICLKKYFNFENYIYNKLTELRKFSGPQLVKDIDKYILSKELENNKKFSEEQKEAIIKVNDGLKIFALCGYGGTGKSMVSKMILELFTDPDNPNRIKKEDIITTSLSGIATDRIKKSTGMNGKTIAHLILNESEKINGKLPFKVYLIDECSMINSEFFNTFLKNLPDNAYIFLVGDPAQVPPIGSGDVFHDILNNGIIPFVELKKIFRQSDDNMIKIFAKSIREGFSPKDYKTKVYADFHFKTVEVQNYRKLGFKVKKNEFSKIEFDALKQKNYINIYNEIIKTYKDIIPKLKEYLKNKNYLDYLYHYQTIVPIKKDILGTENLNKNIQKLLTSNNKFIKLGFKEFYEKDKIIHIMNTNLETINGDNYDLEDILNNNYQSKEQRIFNGMVGIILKIDEINEKFIVYYPLDNIYTIYNFDEAEYLIDLAYTLTIHKTQGSEYNNVILPISFKYFFMLNNKLLYTAITRAKNKIKIIGESYAFEYTCRTNDKIKRETILNRIVQNKYPF